MWYLGTVPLLRQRLKGRAHPHRPADACSALVSDICWKVRWNAIIVSGAGAEVPTAHQAVPTAPHGAWHGFRAVETPTPAHSFRASRPNHRRTVPAANVERASERVNLKCGVGCACRHVVVETPEAPSDPIRRKQCLMSPGQRQTYGREDDLTMLQTPAW